MQTVLESFEAGFLRVFSWPEIHFILFAISAFASYSFAEIKRVLITISAFGLATALAFMASFWDDLQLDSENGQILFLLLLLVLAFMAMGKSALANQQKFKNALAVLLGICYGLTPKFNLLDQLDGNKWITAPSQILGLMLGLVAAAVLLLILQWLLANAFNIVRRDWKLVTSSIVVGICSYLLLGLISN